MIDSTVPTPVLILGCGYLGSRLALQAIEAGHFVDVLSRNPDVLRNMQAAGVRQAVQCQLQSRDWHKHLQATNYQCIFITVGSSESTPDGYRQSYIEGLQSILEWSGAFRGRFIYTSSISVYGPGDGAWFDECTPPAPSGWRGQIILESEGIVSSHPSAKVTILRLGGIYGPGRDRFLRSASSSGSTDYFLNLIHVEDAARAMIRCGQAEGTLRNLYNLTDNHPFLREDLDQFVSKNLTAHTDQQSVSMPAKSHRSTPANRRIRSLNIQTDLDWKPTFPSVFEAIQDLA